MDSMVIRLVTTETIEFLPQVVLFGCQDTVEKAHLPEMEKLFLIKIIQEIQPEATKATCCSILAKCHY